MFLPRAALLRWAEMTLSDERIIRERLPDDAPCSTLLLYDLEGELFFGAAPELDRCFDEVARRAAEGAIPYVLLRIKRARNPDMVALERFEHFMRTMDARGVSVLLCGVRRDFLNGIDNLRFRDWLPNDRVFPEELEVYSSTLHAVRHVYDMIEDNTCAHCAGGDWASIRDAFYYRV
jgi:SulP family sulfate permease